MFAIGFSHCNSPNCYFLLRKLRLYVYVYIYTHYTNVYVDFLLCPRHSERSTTIGFAALGTFQAKPWRHNVNQTAQITQVWARAEKSTVVWYFFKLGSWSWLDPGRCASLKQEKKWRWRSSNPILYSTCERNPWQVMIEDSKLFPAAVQVCSNFLFTVLIYICSHTEQNWSGDTLVYIYLASFQGIEQPELISLFYFKHSSSMAGWWCGLAKWLLFAMWTIF